MPRGALDAPRGGCIRTAERPLLRRPCGEALLELVVVVGPEADVFQHCVLAVGRRVRQVRERLRIESLIATTFDGPYAMCCAYACCAFGVSVYAMYCSASALFGVPFGIAQ
jgi:hypothetical protein